MSRSSDSTKRIAISTGGGDAPGLNAVIQSVVHSAVRLGWEVHGIRDGLDGLLSPEKYRDAPIVRLTPESVANIAHLGGTILGTTSGGNPLKSSKPQADGSAREVDRTEEIVGAFAAHNFDALVAVGGDGSLTIAQALYEKGLRVVGVPKTIDNDLQTTELTFGFSSAVSFATECLDRLHTTAASHRRVIVVEVMGRYVGWIALDSGVAGGADVILIPEIPYEMHKVADHIKAGISGTRSYAIVVVAEGAAPAGGKPVVKEREIGRAEVLGGIGGKVAKELQLLTGLETRSVVLGHLLRGGSPNAQDRLLGLNFGAAAVRALAEGQSGVMAALNPPRIDYVTLKQATATLKRVPRECRGVLAARELGICFGD